MLRQGEDQTIQRHPFTQPASTLRQSRAPQDLVQPQLLPDLMSHMNGPSFARLLQAHALAVDGQHRFALGMGHGRLRLSSSPPACGHRFPLGIGLGQRKLARQTGLHTVGEIEPMLAWRGSETAQGTDDLLPWTFGGAYGFDEKVIVVGFALVRLGGLADIQRALYIAGYRLIAIEKLIPVRHYFQSSRTLC